MLCNPPHPVPRLPPGQASPQGGRGRCGQRAAPGRIMTTDAFKQQAAERALTLVEDGMTLGLGTGSTAARFVDLIGRRVAQGLKVSCVATSRATRERAARLGIVLTNLEERPFLDLTVDGADEIDP